MAEDTEDKEELSMEDILSSIKDILMEDNAEQHKAAQKEEPAPQAAAPQPAPEVSRPAPVETVDDVLTLSPSMIVEPNISTVEAQPETKAEEGADPLDLDFDREFDSLPAEPVLDDIEAGHSAAVDEEPVGLSEIAAAEDAEIVEDSELPDLNFDEPAVDLDAEPIFRRRTMLRIRKILRPRPMMFHWIIWLMTIRLTRFSMQMPMNLRLPLRKKNWSNRPTMFMTMP